MQSTATLLVEHDEASQVLSQAAGETLKDKGERKDGKHGFHRVLTRTVILLVMLVIALSCLTLGHLAWAAAKWNSTKLYLGAENQDRIEGSPELAFPRESRGSGNMEFPLRPKAAARNNVLEPAASPKNAAPLKSPAITRQSPRSMPWTAERHNLARAAASFVKNPEPCITAGCRSQTNYIKRQMNFSADPCHDLYDFVCGNYSGHPDGPYAETEAALRTATISALSAEVVPAERQSAWQKAAGLYQTCVEFAGSFCGQLNELKSWMVSMNLDLFNLTASRTVDPVDMTVRLAVEMGVPVIFDFQFSDDTFLEGKRTMQFRIGLWQTAWHGKREALKKQSATKVYEYFSTQLKQYPGYDKDKHVGLVTTFQTYDDFLVTTLNKHVKVNSEFVFRVIEDMGHITAPHVTPEQWSYLLGNYTKGAYRSRTMIEFQKELLNALKELLTASAWGKDGFRAILAWRLFDGLTEYVQPPKLLGGKEKQEACYHHVLEVMELAMTSRYLRARVSDEALKKAEDMYWHVRDAFDLALWGSEWLKNTVRDFAHRHLDILEVHIRSLKHILGESFVNEHYAQFPDMSPSDLFFEKWLKARSARAKEMWADTKRLLFDMSRASPYYVPGSHSLVIPPGALLPIFFYEDGNTALNYGSLGSALAHQIMNAYDVFGELSYCYNEETRTPFNQSLQCLRDSYAQAGFAPPRGQKDPAEFENVGDVVGAAIAFEAFWNLRGDQQTGTLPDLNLTTAQLFFVGHCMTTCKLDSRKPAGSFASPRARCNVPAMNMDALWAAFRCRPATRMNPLEKCSIWK